MAGEEEGQHSSSREPQGIRHSSVPEPRTMFSGDRGMKSSTIFSLTKGKELIKSRGRVMGKARGRGHAGSHVRTAVTVGKSNLSSSKEKSPAKENAPGPDSSGIVEVKVKHLDQDVEEEREEFPVQQDQFADDPSADQDVADHSSFPEVEDVPGLPLRGSGMTRRAAEEETLLTPIVEGTAKVKTAELTEDLHEMASVGSQRGNATVLQAGLPLQQTAVVPQQPMTKPKRYSSQRQKTGGGGGAERCGQVPGKELTCRCCCFCLGVCCCSCLLFRIC